MNGQKGEFQEWDCIPLVFSTKKIPDFFRGCVLLQIGYFLRKYSIVSLMENSKRAFTSIFALETICTFICNCDVFVFPIKFLRNHLIVSQMKNSKRAFSNIFALETICICTCNFIGTCISIFLRSYPIVS